MRPATLLLADDSTTIHRVIELSFADEDVRIVAVTDGREALRSVDLDQPDIVLADIGIAYVDGYAVASHVKNTPMLRHIPVLLLGGAFEPIDEERAKATGCDGVLLKPLEPKQLVAKVKDLLSHRPSHDLWKGEEAARTGELPIAAHVPVPAEHEPVVDDLESVLPPAPPPFIPPPPHSYMPPVEPPPVEASLGTAASAGGAAADDELDWPPVPDIKWPAPPTETHADVPLPSPTFQAGQGVTFEMPPGPVDVEPPAIPAIPAAPTHAYSEPAPMAVHAAPPAIAPTAGAPGAAADAELEFDLLDAALADLDPAASLKKAPHDDLLAPRKEIAPPATALDWKPLPAAEPPAPVLPGSSLDWLTPIQADVPDTPDVLEVPELPWTMPTEPAWAIAPKPDRVSPFVTPAEPAAAAAAERHAADVPAPPVKLSISSAFSALLSAEQARSGAVAPLPAAVVKPFLERQTQRPAAAAPSAAESAPTIPQHVLEEAVRRVLAEMTKEVVREVVTDTAERMVREEIERIKENPG